MPRLLFALTGSISCYKACHAISRLAQAGIEIQTIVTPAALRFIGPSTLEGLSGRPPLGDLWEPGRAMDHIELARWADLALVCPATAHTLARLAHGLADDLLGSIYLAWELRKKPWWVAPAMNHAMLAHPATQTNLRTLAEHGVRILPTGTGPQACGETGEGRLLEPEALVLQILAQLGTKIA
jgi:phosphopantothenoylcysteine decarboxylase/phosphopantothenate--cysteine ligase